MHFRVSLTLFVLILGCSAHLYAQECWQYEQDVLIEEQSLIDALGDAPCLVIVGDVKISGATISNLDGLSTLTEVGRLEVVETTVSTISLPALQTVTDISIRKNESLTLVEVANLVTARDVTVELSPVQSLDFGGLTTVRTLRLTQTSVADLTGFSNLSSAENLYFIRNGQLVNLEGLDGVTSIVGDLLLSRNPGLDSLQGFNLTAIGGELVIRESPFLDTIADLAPLQSVTGSFTITATGITDFAPTLTVGMVGLYANAFLNGVDLAGLSSASDIRIQGNDALTSIANVPAGSDLRVISNAQLQDMSNLNTQTLNIFHISSNGDLGTVNFPGLTTITDHLLIQSNPVLTSIDVGATSVANLTIDGNAILQTIALNSLTDAGNLFIEDSPQLSSLSVPVLADLVDLEVVNCDALVGFTFPVLDRLEDILLDGNQSLTAPDFPMLTTITDDLRVLNNASLIDFNAFRNVTILADELDVRNNLLLTSFVGLENIPAVDELYIDGNTSLSTLTDLSSLVSIPTLFHVMNNPSLLDCEVTNLLLQVNFNGTLEVGDNGGPGVCP